MSNTKEQTTELINKMKEVTKLTFHNHLSIDLSAEECAQIAVQHAEERVVFFVAELAQELPVIKEENRELRELLDECRIQIEYLHSKFGETGSGNNVLSRVDNLLNK